MELKMNSIAITNALATLSELINKMAFGKECVSLTSQNKCRLFKFG